MKTVIGLFLIAAGIIFGLWAGVWWAFIGGIIAVIEQCKAVDMDATKLAFGIARIVFASFIGIFSAFVLILPGYGFLSAGQYRRW